MLLPCQQRLVVRSTCASQQGLSVAAPLARLASRRPASLLVDRQFHTSLQPSHALALLRQVSTLTLTLTLTLTPTLTLTQAYAADFARLGYDPLDLGHRPRLQTSAADLGYGPLDRGADRGADGRGPSEVTADAEEGARRAAHRRAAASARRRSASAGSAVLLAPVTAPASLPTLPTLPSRGSDFCEMS